MVILGYLLTAIFYVILIPAVDRPGEGALIFHVTSVIQSIAILFILAGLVFGLGRISGGTGTLHQSQALIGWHGLVASLMAPTTIVFIEEVKKAMPSGDETQIDPASIEISGGTMFIGLATAGISLWLLANYVAELHGFKNVWGVIGVMCGLPIAIFVFVAWIATAMTIAGGAA